MKKLLEYLIEQITGSEKFSVLEETKDDLIQLTVEADPEILGLIIGKKGKTIRNIRNLLKVRATLEKKGVNVFVTEKAS